MTIFDWLFIVVAIGLVVWSVFLDDTHHDF